LKLEKFLLEVRTINIVYNVDHNESHMNDEHSVTIFIFYSSLQSFRVLFWEIFSTGTAYLNPYVESFYKIKLLLFLFVYILLHVYVY